jgi:hypothetical protein
MDTMRIESIRFKREENSPEEKGVIINHGDGPILDFKGNVVSPVWDYAWDHEYNMTIYDDKENII